MISATYSAFFFKAGGKTGDSCSGFFSSIAG